MIRGHLDQPIQLNPVQFYQLVSQQQQQHNLNWQQYQQQLQQHQLQLVQQQASQPAAEGGHLRAMRSFLIRDILSGSSSEQANSSQAPTSSVAALSAVAAALQAAAVAATAAASANPPSVRATREGRPEKDESDADESKEEQEREEEEEEEDDDNDEDDEEVEVDVDELDEDEEDDGPRQSALRHQDRHLRESRLIAEVGQLESLARQQQQQRNFQAAGSQAQFQQQLNSPLDALFQMTSSTFDALKRGDKRKDRDADNHGSNNFTSKQASKKKRKSRTAFTNNQIYELERRFRIQRYLSPTDRDEIAMTLNLSNAQVITWFQNRRAKLKRDLEEQKRDIETASFLNLASKFSAQTFLDSYQALSQMNVAIKKDETTNQNMNQPT